MTSPEKKLPVPGELFEVGGHPAFLICPDSMVTGFGSWVWYAPTLLQYPDVNEIWMLERFLEAGIPIAGIDVGESAGNPEGRIGYSALYNHLVDHRGFGKPTLLARSRGGLMLLNWAVENADRVAAIAGIYPVCNLESYPGVDPAAEAYGMTADELRDRLPDHNPIDRLGPLARARVPVYIVHGDSDEVVPLEANSGELARRYAQLGGSVQLTVAGGEGHSLSDVFFRDQRLVDFVIATCLEAGGV